MAESPEKNAQGASSLRRSLTLWNLIIIGMIIIQPTAPMSIYGVVSNKAGGHVVTAVLIAMVAMLFTAVSYGRMARVYPSAGSAYTYVGKEIHPVLGYVTGWSMVMDYILNPLVCVAFCSRAAMNIIPGTSYYFWIVFFAGLFTFMNMRGVKTSARVNEWMCAAMCVVVLLFFGFAARYIIGAACGGMEFFTKPFYDPAAFSVSTLFAGTAAAALTYIGFDGISTLSEEAENPKRNILLATVLVCLIAGILSALEVYAAQLIWGPEKFQPDQVESAFAIVAGHAGGSFLFQLVNGTLLLAGMGSGMGSQLAAGRLLYGMGRGGALPKFFSVIEPKRGIPRNSVAAVGVFALTGAAALQLLSGALGAGAFEIGAQVLNFGAFIAFMGVNASAIACHWVRAEKKTFSNLVPPLLGFLICGYIWLMLSPAAQIVGGIWMALGIIYGAVRTKGFRSGLISFDAPSH
jgi:amino acid transporter